MKKVALVDIGSNTIRLNAYIINGSDFTMIFSEKEPFGMINFIEDGFLSPHGIEKFISLIKNYKWCVDNTIISNESSSGELYCFATAALRGIKNRDAVLCAVKEKTGTDINVISGEDEAMYNFYSIRRFFDVDDGMVIDMGGGSTEFLKFGKSGPEDSVSINIASLVLAKRFVSKILPRKKEIDKIERICQKNLNTIDFIDGFFSNIFIVGGTARAIAKIHKELKGSDSPVNGYVLRVHDIREILEIYKKDKKILIPLIIKEIPDRAYSFLPGLILFTRIFEKVKCHKIIVSSFGVREGYLLKNIIGDDLNP